MQKREVKPGRPIGSKTFESAPAIAFGLVVRERRKTLGISQEALAAMTDVDRSHMSKLERGVHLPNLAMILKLARVLNCKPGKLVDQTLERMDEV
jgi:transcriptional regulator with XRE-family HTH domain